MERGTRIEKKNPVREGWDLRYYQQISNPPQDEAWAKLKGVAGLVEQHQSITHQLYHLLERVNVSNH
jgi:hypothetical protein